MNAIKKVLVTSFNKAYDYYLDLKLYIKWKRDLHVQKLYGIPKILSMDETLDRMIDKQCSLCRYGDGEFKIMDGDRILFQPQSEDLAKRLIEVIKSKENNILICIPSFFDQRKKKTPSGLSKEEKHRYDMANKYMKNIIADRRLRWYQYFDMEREYGEACVSRFYASVYDNEKSERWINKWKSIWKNRNLLIVEGEQTRLGVGNDLFDGALSIRRLLAPAKGAFQLYDAILSSTMKEYRNGDLVLIALGPTATVLAYDLSMHGIQALDIGHIDIEYEWYLKKDRTHQRIDGKYVSEAVGGDMVTNFDCPNYDNQIIYRISQ